MSLASKEALRGKSKRDIAGGIGHRSQFGRFIPFLAQVSDDSAIFMLFAFLKERLLQVRFAPLLPRLLRVNHVPPLEPWTVATLLTTAAATCARTSTLAP